MSEFILPGDPPVRVLLRRTASARRYSLRVSRLDGRVTLTMPPRASEARALDFIREKDGWIRNRLSERDEDVQVALGTTLRVHGKDMMVVAGPRSRIARDSGRIEVRAGARPTGETVAGLLKSMARREITAASDHFAARLGRPYARITLRDTRSRWGSCSTEGALMYSWRLILAPPDVLTYVCAHEVAHLAEMNHGPRFWATVEDLWPDYRAHRGWLRKNGEHLHRYRFTDPHGD